MIPCGYSKERFHTSPGQSKPLRALERSLANTLMQRSVPCSIARQRTSSSMMYMSIFALARLKLAPKILNVRQETKNTLGFHVGNYRFYKVMLNKKTKPLSYKKKTRNLFYTRCLHPLSKVLLTESVKRNSNLYNFLQWFSITFSASY